MSSRSRPFSARSASSAWCAVAAIAAFVVLTPGCSAPVRASTPTSHANTPQAQGPAPQAHGTAPQAHGTAPQAPAAKAEESAPLAAPAPAPVAPRTLALPHGWGALAPADFETALASWNPGGEPGRLDAESLALLARTLDQDTSRALRAVLLLAHASDPAADAVLVSRLEKRVAPIDFAFPAVDVTAAAALARRLPGADDAAAQRAAVLEELAHGRRPHTMMAVRTECAASALRLGRLGASAFLLGVLREGTPAREPRPTWVRGETRTEDLAWSQWRAAEALSERAGVPCVYRAEAPAVERAQTALELEQILFGARPSTPPASR